MLEDLRNYLQLASGITEATTAKAREVVSGLLATGISLTSKAMSAPDVVGQVQELADDLVATSRNNREMLVGLIRSEVDKAVGRMGFVREDELAALRKHVQRVERDLADLAASCAHVEPDAAGAAAADASGDTTVLHDIVVAVEPAGSDSADSEPGEPVKRKKKVLLEDPDGAHG